jgi:hypothetical protein
MDDAEVERATLFASALATGGVVLFATQAPERVDALFLWAPFAHVQDDARGGLDRVRRQIGGDRGCVG